MPTSRIHPSTTGSPPAGVTAIGSGTIEVIFGIIVVVKVDVSAFVRGVRLWISVFGVKPLNKTVLTSSGGGCVVVSSSKSRVITELSKMHSLARGFRRHLLSSLLS